MGLAEILKRSELFVGLDDEAIRKITSLPSCQIRELGDQEVIFNGGDQASHLYVVAEGRVHLLLKFSEKDSGPQGESRWGVITKGGVFGWGALVPPHIRIGSAVSSGFSLIVSISGAELRELFDKDTQLGYEVMKGLVKIISSRVWNIERLLATGKRSPFI